MVVALLQLPREGLAGMGSWAMILRRAMPALGLALVLVLLPVAPAAADVTLDNGEDCATVELNATGLLGVGMLILPSNDASSVVLTVFSRATRAEPTSAAIYVWDPGSITVGSPLAAPVPFDSHTISGSTRASTVVLNTPLVGGTEYMVTSAGQVFCGGSAVVMPLWFGVTATSWFTDPNALAGSVVLIDAVAPAAEPALADTGSGTEALAIACALLALGGALLAIRRRRYPAR